MNEQTVELRISGVDCAECASGLEKALARLSGVRTATVLLGAEKAIISRPRVSAECRGLGLQLATLHSGSRPGDFRRGFIDCAAIRHPGPSIDQGIVDDLEETLSLLDTRQASIRGAPP